MTRYLVDSNHLGAANRRVSQVRDRIQERCRKGDVFGTCVPVLCELEAGIQQMPDPATGRRRLRNTLKHVRIWPLDLTIAEPYGALWLELNRAGRSLSQVDMLLATLARQWRLILLTSDRDFDALPDIRKENWM